MKYLFMIVLLVLQYNKIEAETVFKGEPIVRQVIDGVNNKIDTLNTTDKDAYRVVISNIDGKYYWATRENRELMECISGFYISFVAIDGSGYIRYLMPDTKKKFRSVGKFMGTITETEEKYDYVEFVFLGLKSITYYGTSK